MDATATLNEANTLPLAESASPRRAVMRMPKRVRVKAPRVVKVHQRYQSANFKRMEAAAKVRAKSVSVRTSFWAVSGVFHALLIAGLGAVLMAEHIESDARPVIITDLTFYEAAPPVEILRQPELLLAGEMADEALELPAESKPEEEKAAAPSELADATSDAPVATATAEPVEGAEIIHSVETDFSRVKFRGSARSAGSGKLDADAAAQSVVAPVAATTQVPPSASGNGAVSRGTGVTRGAAPISLSVGAYPKRALKEKREGLVELRVEVLANGRVGLVELYLSSGHADLDETALKAAKDWIFSPAQNSDGPVATTILVPVRYEVRNAR